MKDPFARQLWLSFSIIGTAIVGAAIVLFFVLSDVNIRAGVIARSQTAVATRNGDLAALTKLQADAPAAAGYETAFTKLLSTQDNLIQFPRQVQSLAAAYNVVVQASFISDPSVPTPGVAGVVSFSLNASGKPDDLLAFLKNIETQSTQFLVAIDSVDFSLGDANGRLRTTGRVFFQ